MGVYNMKGLVFERLRLEAVWRWRVQCRALYIINLMCKAQIVWLVDKLDDIC